MALRWRFAFFIAGKALYTRTGRTPHGRYARCCVSSFFFNLPQGRRQYLRRLASVISNSSFYVALHSVCRAAAVHNSPHFLAMCSLATLFDEVTIFTLRSAVQDSALLYDTRNACEARPVILLVRAPLLVHALVYRTVAYT